MTYDQKKEILKIVKDHLKISGNEKVFQFDLDKLNNQCLVELRNYVN